MSRAEVLSRFQDTVTQAIAEAGLTSVEVVALGLSMAAVYALDDTDGDTQEAARKLNAILADLLPVVAVERWMPRRR